MYASVFPCLDQHSFIDKEFVNTMGPWLEQNLGKKIDRTDLERAFDDNDRV